MAKKPEAKTRETPAQMRGKITDLSYINSHLTDENKRLGNEASTAQFRAHHLSEDLAHAAHPLGVAAEGLSARGAHETARLVRAGAMKYQPDNKATNNGASRNIGG